MGGQLTPLARFLPPLPNNSSTEDSLRDFLSAADSFLEEMGSLFIDLERLDLNGSESSESMYSISTVSSASLDSTVAAASEDYRDASDTWSWQAQEGSDANDDNDGDYHGSSGDFGTTAHRSVRPERQTLWLPERLQDTDAASTHSNWDMTSVGLYLMYGDTEDLRPSSPSSASTSDHSSTPSPLFVYESESESQELQSPQTSTMTATAHGSPTGFSEVKLSKSLERNARVPAEDSEDDIFTALLKADYPTHDPTAGERENHSFAHFLGYYFGIGVDAEGTTSACTASGDSEEEIPRTSLMIDHGSLRERITTWLGYDLSRVALYQDSPDAEDISLEGTKLLSRSNSCSHSHYTRSTTPIQEHKISLKYSTSITRKVQSSISFQGDLSHTSTTSIQRTIPLSSTGSITRKSSVLSSSSIRRTAALSPSTSLRRKVSISRRSTPLRRKFSISASAHKLRKAIGELDTLISEVLNEYTEEIEFVVSTFTCHVRLLKISLPL
jgi:hypothetical protein